MGYEDRGHGEGRKGEEEGEEQEKGGGWGVHLERR